MDMFPSHRSLSLSHTFFLTLSLSLPSSISLKKRRKTKKNDSYMKDNGSDLVATTNRKQIL